ncbi:rod shape-determining protein RodA [Alphaproteobacteria bacterium]|nr:rod shape-determining protein RodA [Alphaproteobacteria bacterium]
MLLNYVLNVTSVHLKRLYYINYILLVLAISIFVIGLTLLYSAGDGSMEPWAKKQLIKFIISVCVFLLVATINIRFWLGSSYYIYAFSLFLLVLVNFYGNTGIGSQRWLDLGYFNLQPSELMKFSLILVLARFFHREKQLGLWSNCKSFIYSLIIICFPAYLIFLQPDLGSSILVIIASITILFVIGLSIWFFISSAVLIIILAPLAWIFLLYDYQKNRIYTFLDPLRDPLGSGYHIIQSKIALGSGGIFGKGFLQGTQSHLSFLPEMQTDFIFTLLAEEFGIIGTFILLLLFIVLIFYSLIIGLISKSRFACFVSIGVAINIFYYVFINTAMVSGLIPVVGVPLPLVSYGGTSMICVMFGLGLVSNAYLFRNEVLPRYKDGFFGW